jgi:hypothetical protein
MTHGNELLEHKVVLASFARLAEYLRQVIMEQEAQNLLASSSNDNRASDEALVLLHGNGKEEPAIETPTLPS